MQNTQAKDDALPLDGDFGTMFGFNDELDDEIADMFNNPQVAWVVQSKPNYL